MNTKRCAYCHKLQQADALVCNRCGHAFVKNKTRELSRDLTKPSIPPASPHRAGHYSGLHPEDQPYLSSKIAVQRPQPQEVSQWRWTQAEPEHIILPATGVNRNVKVDPEESRETLQTVRQARAYTTSPWPERPTFVPRKPFWTPRIISIMLAISCICFLLASSLLAFAMIGHKESVVTAAIKAAPDVMHFSDTFTLSGSGFGARDLMSFTNDANETINSASGKPLETHTDSQGNFVVQISVPGDWEVGAHFIHATDEAQSLSLTARITIQAASGGMPGT